jgi:hypothetical protein
MLLLSILHSDTYKYVFNIVVFRNISSVSSVTGEATRYGVCIDMYYTYKYILASIFVFLERKLLLFLLLFLLLKQTMKKYNNVK